MPAILRLITLLTFFITTSAIATTPLEQSITQLAALISDGYAQEYKEARYILYPNANRNYALALFSMEGQGGGNGYVFYMAKFTPNQEADEQQNTPLKNAHYALDTFIPIGGKFMAAIRFDETVADDNKILLYGDNYTDSDPACCPSQPFIRQYDPIDLSLKDEHNTPKP